MKTKLLAWSLALSATMAVTNVGAAPVVYFGEDLGAASAAAIPNSTAARNAFASHLSSYGLQNFESFAGDSVLPACCGPLTFVNSSITATITGGTIRDAPRNARFAISGTNYVDTSFNQRINFSSAVAAFGLFVTDANEIDNDPATATLNGELLTPEQILARPFDSIDGIFRIVTERSPGVFEVLFDSGTFQALDSSALFAGIIDAANPFTNVILINGASGLDVAFQDGFGYDDFMVATAAQVVPEPGSIALLTLAVGGLVYLRRRPR
jgi:hypothetical protein